MPNTPSATIEQSAELSDALYAEKCRQQIAEAADCVANDTWRQSRFFESFTNAFVDRAKSAALCIDVGAERGFYTHLARRYLPSGGRIIALEPDPHRAAALREFYTDDSSVTIMQAAAAAIGGTIQLTKDNDHSASQRMASGKLFAVKAVVLDQFPDATQADLIKIDVEGAEAEVLASMTAILDRQQCHVFVEFHPWADEITPNARQRIREIARAHGYDIRRTDIESNDPNRLVGGRMILSPATRKN